MVVKTPLNAGEKVEDKSHGSALEMGSRLMTLKTVSNDF